MLTFFPCRPHCAWAGGEAAIGFAASYAAAFAGASIGLLLKALRAARPSLGSPLFADLVRIRLAVPACRERQKPFRIQPFIERQRYDLAQKLSTRLTRFLPSMRKAGGSITPDDDKKLIELLRSRDALRTRLELRDGTALDVWNIAWGYDHGDDFAHITSNISPEQDGSSIDFFFTHQVKKVIDPESGAEIIEFS